MSFALNTVVHSQALQHEGVSAAAIQSMLDDVDRDRNRRIDYDEVTILSLSDAAEWHSH
jgi:Ca2+-binding EF-hand superfamily protein